jgi:hypothetical protein
MQFLKIDFQFDLKMTNFSRSIKKNPTWRSSPEIVSCLIVSGFDTTEFTNYRKLIGIVLTRIIQSLYYSPASR